MLREMVYERTKAWTDEGLSKGAKKGFFEGMTTGHLEGRARGRMRGKAEVLLRQITAKFGPLSEATTAQVLAADAETLWLWGDRIIDAARPEDIVSGKDFLPDDCDLEGFIFDPERRMGGSLETSRIRKWPDHRVSRGCPTGTGPWRRRRPNRRGSGVASSSIGTSFRGG